MHYLEGFNIQRINLLIFFLVNTVFKHLHGNIIIAKDLLCTYYKPDSLFTDFTYIMSFNYDNHKEDIILPKYQLRMVTG